MRQNPILKSARFAALLGSLLCSIAASAHAELRESDAAIAKRIIESFYEAAENPASFWAPKNLSWIVDEYDSDTLLRIGLAYLTGDGADQDMEKAAIVLGGLHAVTTTNSYSGSSDAYHPRPKMSDQLVGALAHAARVSASAYAEKAQGTFNFFDPSMDRNFRLNSGFLQIAIEADSQDALIMKAYLYRLTRQAEANLGNKLSAAGNEKAHFEKASNCTAENTGREITPWSQEVCDKAAQELRASASAYETLLADHLSQQEVERQLAAAEKWDWALIILSGFAASIAANMQSSGGDAPLSAMEQYERERRYIEHQTESTWGHVGAAMFVN